MNQSLSTLYRENYGSDPHRMEFIKSINIDNPGMIIVLTLIKMHKLFIQNSKFFHPVLNNESVEYKILCKLKYSKELLANGVILAYLKELKKKIGGFSYLIEILNVF